MIASEIVADRALSSADTKFWSLRIAECSGSLCLPWQGEGNTIEKALKLVEADEAAGTLHLRRIDRATTFVLAEKLSASSTRTDGYRALGILHVAAAVSIGCSDFGSFDIRQRKLAATAGLILLPKKMPGQSA